MIRRLLRYYRRTRREFDPEFARLERIRRWRKAAKTFARSAKAGFDAGRQAGKAITKGGRR